MKVALVGSRYFAATVFEALRNEEGLQFSSIVAPADDDRLALAARAAGLEVHVLANPKIVPAEAIAEGTDLIIAAHTHARVSNEALARSRLGGVGYHPSLLPRHRGIAAVEWTILEGDPIAGGSVYHLADGWDAGAIAAQDWCFVAKGESARELWERELAPMGLRLLTQVVRDAARDGRLRADTQDPRFATRAPMTRKPVLQTDPQIAANVSLVVTVMGQDRPGIVRLISDKAQRFGANWTDSRMARMAGEFAGMVHFEVPREQADALSAALRGLESSGLRVAIAQSEFDRLHGGARGVSFELVGDDKPGIIANLTRMLAERNISIEHLHTELIGSDAGTQQRFKVVAHLRLPPQITREALRADLAVLAADMLVDIALDEEPEPVRQAA
ncbi:ACT domain-containing protein [Piscinibacter sakaiensis]|uniref:ACT domain-containing protein n=1 Tax=Piscinibacter sakaiensis TaxID=1547922 RepID=UPI003AAF3EED